MCIHLSGASLMPVRSEMQICELHMCNTYKIDTFPGFVLLVNLILNLISSAVSLHHHSAIINSSTIMHTPMNELRSSL